MTIDEIKEFIRVAEETGLAELEYQRGDERIRIRRQVPGAGHEVILPAVLPVPVASSAVHAPMATIPALAPAPVASPAPRIDEERTVTVKSPIVGTYYDAPSPGSAPFVKVGDVVHAKQVLCIIESMKLMNEIEAEISGTIVGKLIDNSRPVEYGEALFTIRPA